MTCRGILLKITNMSKVELWDPFHTAFPNFTRIELPNKLRPITDIPMSNLIRELQTLRAVTNSKDFPYGSLIGTGMVGLVLLIAMITMYKRYGLGRLCRDRLAMRERKESGKPVTELSVPVPLTTDEGDLDDSEDHVTAAETVTPKRPTKNAVIKIYPVLPEDQHPTDPSPTTTVNSHQL